MELYSSNESYKLYQGNMLDMLEVINPNSIDSIITDPPYELNFMSKGWDNAGVSFQVDTWKNCYEVLKPGGYLLAFGGSRTFHRIACAIEDAGFEIRDTIMWLYGSGFPKSLNISKTLEKREGIIEETTGTLFNNPGGKRDLSKRSDYGYIYEPQLYLAKQWQGWGTALKPSYEPIIVARKPFKGSLVDNVLEYGVGGINIDECRVESNDSVMVKKGVSGFAKNYTSGEYSFTNVGRFPANTILTYDESDFDEVCGGFPNTKGDNRTSKQTYDKSIWGNAKSVESNCLYADSGSASRYFYCAKASKRDRDEGLDDQQEQKVNDGRNTPIDNAFQRGETLRKNTHPTVKPTSLMQYLVRLVTPNNGIVLDPFNGSGSTGKAVMYENKERNKNYKYIGIELTEEYLPIAKARIEYVCNLKEEPEKQMNIFEFMEDNQ